MPSIINSDDGVVSGTSGLKTTGGNDGALNIQTNGSNAISISSGQRSTFPTTIGVGGATPSTSGSGISFPATQSASTNANTLDDYEEGTWEPDIRPETGSFTSVTYSADTGGFYLKIGKLLYLTGTVRWTAINTTGGSDGVRIGNLPFTSASRSDGDNADAPGPIASIVWNGTASKVPQLIVIQHNGTFFRVATQDANAVLSYIQVADLGSACALTFATVVYTAS